MKSPTKEPKSPKKGKDKGTNRTSKKEKDEKKKGKKKLFSSYGVYSIQGHRPTMEDSHVALQNSKVAFFGVFDGHGGPKAAEFCAKKLHLHLLEEPTFKEQKFKRAFKRAFHASDEEFCKEAASKGLTDGTTALCAMITKCRDKEGETNPDKRILVLANLGDSRAVLSRKGKPKGVTVDHKPSDKEERARIEQYGGVLLGGHINGRLGCSRSIGDIDFKINEPLTENMVISTPDVWKYFLTEDLEFLILACDGVWDVITNQNAVNIVRTALQAGSSAHTAAKTLVMSALKYGSTDNITTLVVVFEAFDGMRGGRKVEE